MATVSDPIIAPGPVLPTTAAVWPEPGAPPLAVKPPLGPRKPLLRLEWPAGGRGLIARCGDYNLWAFPDGGWQVCVTAGKHAEIVAEDGRNGWGRGADLYAAQLLAEAALMAWLKAYRPMLEVNDGR